MLEKSSKLQNMFQNFELTGSTWTEYHSLGDDVNAVLEKEPIIIVNSRGENRTYI